MNKLLPSKEELIPITQDRTTFYDCGFNVPFDDLPFIKKLQVINDVVRESLLPCVFSNPDSDEMTLIGNCHTAALVSINYLKELNLGKNHRYVLARRKSYQPEDITTKHALVLVDDDYGNTYQFDATPFVGYGYGTVKKISEERLYEEYIPIEGEIEYLMHNFRKIMYKCHEGLLTEEEFKHYIDILEYAKKYPSLNGFISYCYGLLAKIPNSPYDTNTFLSKSLEYNPYNSSLNKNTKKLLNRKNLALKQIKIWQSELHDLLSNPTKDERRQLELAQNIVQELKLYDPTYERFLTYQGKNIPLSHLSPRFFMEEGLNVAAIKASAYHLGVRGTIRERILTRGNSAIGEYFTNLAAGTEQTGLKPILYSHTLGDEYERSMNGPADIFLVKMPADKLYKIKKALRSELGKNIINREVMWNDGEPILWHPFVTNLVHSSDTPCETSLHYLMGYPEHQLMTRFMYPNPKLEEKVLRK